MSKLWKKVLAASAAGALVLGLTACGGSGDGGSGDGHLVFMIWDSGQKSGMEAIADAYMEEHPDVTIEVQASGWDEYWTKLEAAAKSNSLRISSGCTPIRCIHMRTQGSSRTARIS